MFQNCLRNITDDKDLRLSEYDTSNVINMKNMFYDTSTCKMKTLDLSNFDMSKVGNCRIYVLWIRRNVYTRPFWHRF